MDRLLLCALQYAFILFVNGHGNLVALWYKNHDLQLEDYLLPAYQAMFPESNERAAPYHLCRLMKPYIPEAGSNAPSFDWPSARNTSYRSPPASEVAKDEPPPTADVISQKSKRKNAPSHTANVISPKQKCKSLKGRSRRVAFKNRNGSLPASESCSTKNSSSDLFPLSPVSRPTSSAHATATPMQIPTSAPYVSLARMTILEAVARNAANLSQPSGQRCQNDGAIQVSNTSAAQSVFSRYSPPKPAGRQSSKPLKLTPPSQIGPRNEWTSASGAFESGKRKRKREDDSEVPPAPVRVSKRRRTPTERAQAQAQKDTPCPMKTRSGRGKKTLSSISSSEPKLAETPSLATSLSPLAASASAAQPRRSSRRRNAVDR